MKWISIVSGTVFSTEEKMFLIPVILLVNRYAFTSILKSQKYIQDNLKYELIIAFHILQLEN